EKYRDDPEVGLSLMSMMSCVALSITTNSLAQATAAASTKMASVVAAELGITRTFPVMPFSSSQPPLSRSSEASLKTCTGKIKYKFAVYASLDRRHSRFQIGKIITGAGVTGTGASAEDRKKLFVGGHRHTFANGNRKDQLI